MFGVPATLKKQFVTVVLIFSLIFVFTPQKSDGIIIGIFTLLAGVGAVTFVLDVLVILCVTGVICGNNNNNNNASPGDPPDPQPVEGDQCVVRNACNMEGTGSLFDDGTGNLFCNAVPPDDSLCGSIDLPLDNDSLNIINSIVRRGDDIRVEWDTQGNLATNCTIEGPGFPASFTMATSGTQFVANVQSPYRYSLSCGDDTITKILRIVPEIAEQ